MTIKWRFLPRLNTFPEVVAEIITLTQFAARQEHVTNTVLFWGGTKEFNCLTYGVMNDPEMEYDIEYCKEHGIGIRKAPVGGGPVYVNGEQGAGIAILFDIRDYGLKTLGEVMQKIVTGLAEAYSQKFGVPFRYKPVNDLEIQDRDGIWKKVSIVGSAFLGNAGGGHLLISVRKLPSGLDLNKMMKYVPEKFVDKAEETRTAAARAASVEDAVGREVFIDEGFEAYKDMLKKTFDAELVPSELSKEETELKNTVMKMQAEEKYIFERSERFRLGEIPPDVKVGRYIRKIIVPEGGGPLVRITALVKGDTLYDVRIAGSFHVAPLIPFPEVNTPLHEIERNLKGVPIDEKVILGKIEEIFQKPGYSVEKTTPEDLKDCIMHAIEKAT
jgi:lipoate-protein ligase A